MKTINFTIQLRYCGLIILLSFLQIEKSYSQLVTTLISQYPGDGEMSFDSLGFIYVNQSEVNGSLIGDAVWKVDPQSGNFSQFRSNLPIWLVGSAFDLKGNLLVTGWSAGIITKINPNGSSDEEFSNSINGAGSLELDEFGNVYVAEYLDNAVLKYDSVGNLLETYKSPQNISKPAGLAYLVSTGELFVSNWEDGKISIIDSNGNISNFSNVPSLNGGPIKIFDEYLYVTSPLRHIIYRIPLNDPLDINVFSGILDSPGHNNGSIETATYDTPTGIGSNDGGNTIYIAEKFNGAGRLRRIDNVLGFTESNISNNIKLIPNPGTNKLIVLSKNSSDDLFTKTTISIFDSNGNKVQTYESKSSLEKIELNIENLSSGMYFLAIRSNNISKTLKFIKD